MTDTTKQMIEADMPGWTLDETPRLQPLAHADGSGRADFVAKDLATVREKYDLQGPLSDSKATGTKAAKGAVPEQGRLVRVRPCVEQDESAVVSRTAVVVGGKVVGFSG